MALRLPEIIAAKKSELKELKRRFPQSRLQKAIERNYNPHNRRGFKQALSHGHRLNIVAEIKKASPSEGLIREKFDALDIARVYDNVPSIKCISVLTEQRFFKGRISYLKTVREVTYKPLLRKDFIIDPYQIFESAVYSADAVLLIACILTNEELKNYILQLQELNIDALVEVHNDMDLQKALDAGAEIIGINNRNLNTFEVSLDTSEHLVRKIPKGKVVICESGIHSKKDLDMLMSLGVHNFLIGTAFMRSANIIDKIQELTA